MESNGRGKAGFVLPVMLILLGALVILGVGLCVVSGLEKTTTGRYLERLQAELAADAALRDVRALMEKEMANDEFLVIGASPPEGATERSPVDLFIAMGSVEEDQVKFRYRPLFSAESEPEETGFLEAPVSEEVKGEKRCRFQPLSYLDEVEVTWCPIRDEAGKTVARYACWVEDSQGKLDPRFVGNLKGKEETHERAKPPFPAPGLNPDADEEGQPALDQIPLYALDPDATEEEQGEFGKNLIENRGLLISPKAGQGVLDLAHPLERDERGILIDPKARALEEHTSGLIRSYEERPMIPYVEGIEREMMEKSRLNLNALLAQDRRDAVDEMVTFIDRAYPKFKDRKGGFPEDYLKTLAANALDYADEDSEASMEEGEYRGIDSYPLLSEIALQVNYLGLSKQDGRSVMTFRFKMFAELVNLTNKPVKGRARLSYEISLPLEGIGANPGDVAFDSPELLSKPEVAVHDLTKIGDRYWSVEVEVDLLPNQYRCYRFYDVIYRMDVGPDTMDFPPDTPFSLNEEKGASGLSLRWNDREVERIPRILRQAGLVYSVKNGVVYSGYRIGKTDTLTKAAVPGLVYDDFPDMYYNTGDARMSHYLREAVLDENAYPENASPNRRNIRTNIYKADVPQKPKVYARVMPSEWPDGGHNSAVGSWTPGTSDKTEMTDVKFQFPYDPKMADAAPQAISNAGRFYSVTELGRVFDPIMYEPTFANPAETMSLKKSGRMPVGKFSWPDVDGSPPSGFFGGGNTLRIGRPEHPDFCLKEEPGMCAAGLLDLFHVGQSRNEEKSKREGPLVKIQGHVNLNTATREVLRTIASGALVMDPLLSRRTASEHEGAPSMAPPVEPLELKAPMLEKEADRIVNAIVGGRPYASPSRLADLKDEKDRSVFGNRELYKDGGEIEWNDAAAEEVFARMYEAGTVRSRNFRVWIVAQALSAHPSADDEPEVLAEVRKVHTLFVDPGERDEEGGIVPKECKTRVIFSHGF
ncbi:MAG: hypothetical protein QM627_09530 [Luteolibacter sp.]